MLASQPDRHRGWRCRLLIRTSGNWGLRSAFDPSLPSISISCCRSEAPPKSRFEHLRCPHLEREVGMRRRDVLGVLAGAASAWPITALAQQPAMPVIGFLSSASAQGYARQILAFRQGLQEAGYREGNNVGVDYRWADDQYDRLPALALDLIRRQVGVIVANSPAV